MTRTPQQWKHLILLSLMIALGEQLVRADTYEVGDVVTNFSFIARRQFTRPDGTVVPAGSRVHIRDFPGHIVFLEWFAVWCPFCQAAAPQVKSGIVDWYASRGGNPNGVAVLHIAVNQEAYSYYQPSTDSFIDQQGFGIVVNDYDSSSTNAVRFLFQSYGQPTFAVINCVTNSPSHEAWECLVNYLGYGQTDFSQTLANFRNTIDTVQAPPPTPPVLESPHPVDGDFEFTIQTEPGSVYEVQGSSDLAHWNKLTTVGGSNESVVFRDTNAPPDQYFYRVLRQ